MSFHVKIKSTGSYTPEKILSNEEIAKTVDTNPVWIYETLGIKNRRIAKKNEKSGNNPGARRVKKNSYEKYKEF